MADVVIKPKKRRGQDFGGIKKAPKERGPLLKQLLIGSGLLCLTVLIVTAVWYVTRIPSLQIAGVTVIGGETVPGHLLKDRADAILAETYFHLVPKRFVCTYPDEEIVAALQTIDRVKEVRLELAEDNELIVAFTEYVPAALWCDAIETTRCLFLDRAGYAFSDAPPLIGETLVRYIDEQNPPARGATPFSSEFVATVSDFIQRLKSDAGLFVVGVTVGEESDVTLLLAGGGELLVSLAEPVQKTISNLLSILQSEEFAHLEPGNFKYIDLRFGNKVFVNEEVAPTLREGATSTATTTSE